MESTKLPYRAELDGLRGLMLAPIVLFHGGFRLFPGGYIGVDVFFVISGYLITSLLLRELETGRVRFGHFWLRRARRILPALFFVVAVGWIPAWLFMLPADMRQYAQSVAAAAVLGTNVLFWRQSGYFETESELKPLLHTWSLSVEEQFYLLFPLALALVWRLGRRGAGISLALALLASLGLAEWASVHKPSANYYLLPTRAWELLAGALPALWLGAGRRATLPPRLAAALAMSGLLMVVACLFLYNPQMPFPGLLAVAPVGGSVLVLLAASPRNLAGRILASRALAGLGLISYSVYLWHQPLFAFARHRTIEPPSTTEYLLLSAAAFLVAWPTWRWVEQPFRKGRGIPPRILAGAAIVGSIALLVTGLAGHFTDGFVNRHKWDPARDAIAVLAERDTGQRYCREHRVDSSLGPMVCKIGADGAEPDGVLWGDSTGASLIPGLHPLLQQQGRAFWAVISDGCIPIEGGYRLRRPEFGCTPGRHRQTVAAILDDPGIRDVVWIGGFDLADGEIDDYRLDGLQQDRPPSAAQISERVVHTLKAMRAAGKHVVLVANSPSLPYPAAMFAIRQHAAHTATELAGQQIQQLSHKQMRLHLGMNALLAAAAPHSELIDAMTVLCGNRRCSSHDDTGALLLVDERHLSHRGATKLASRICSSLNCQVPNAKNARVPRRE